MEFVLPFVKEDEEKRRVNQVLEGRSFGIGIRVTPDCFSFQKENPDI